MGCITVPAWKIFCEGIAKFEGRTSPQILCPCGLTIAGNASDIYPAVIEIMRRPCGLDTPIGQSAVHPNLADKSVHPTQIFSRDST
jgi:hypothetical protein